MKKIRVAINGFGRIGRAFVRVAWERPEIEIVAINDLGDIKNLAYLLKYDTVYHTWPHDVSVSPEGKFFIIDRRKQIAYISQKDPMQLPWQGFNVDVVVESTGLFESFEKSKVHLAAGAKHVVISAPAKDPEREDSKTVLLGINEDEFKNCKITSNGSCTTNAAHPVIQVLHEALGIKKAFLSTTHGYTATQGLVDGLTRGSDFRRGRAAAENIVPSSTGAAVSVTRAVKDLAGKFDGVALRVPVVCGSVAQITFVAGRQTTVEEVNDILKKAAAEPRWNKIFKVTEEQIVSSDIIGESHAAVADLNFTRVVDGDLVSVMSWYDNEMGYTHALVEHVIKAGESL